MNTVFPSPTRFIHPKMGCTFFSPYTHSIVEQLVKKMKRKTTPPLTLPGDMIIEIL